MNARWIVVGLVVLLVLACGVASAKIENLIILESDNESKSLVIEYNISDEFLGLGYISDSPFLHLNNLSEYKPITSPKVGKMYADTRIFPNIITDTIRCNTIKQQVEIVNDHKVESNTNLTRVPPYYGLFQIYENSSENASKVIPFETVFPPDDRKRILDTAKYPWRTICQLLIDWPNGDKSLCSGAIIDNFHVLTAGHCVYDKSEGGWAKSIKVIPGLNKDYMPFSYAWVTYMRTYKGWTWFQMREHDWAVLTLDRNIGKYTGWMGRMTRDPSDPIYRGILNTAGYPGDKEEGTMWHDADYGRDANEYIHWYYMDTYKGQSGSPVWVYYSNGGRYILTVHTRGDDGTHSNSGTRLNKDNLSSHQK